MRSHFDADWASVSPMAGRKAFSPDLRRRALREFMRAKDLKVFPWTQAAGVSEASLRNFLNGDSESLSDRTYALLARAAHVSVGKLRGDEAPPEAAEVPVRSYVGAGDEILPVEGDAPIEYVPAPPGMEECEATEVRGVSMQPLYHHGDLLFHRRIDAEPARYRNEVVVVQVRNGKRLVKLLQAGSKKGLYTLVSLNPSFAPMPDQKISWIGPIEWVQKRRRL